MLRITKLYRRLCNIIHHFFTVPYFGFVQGHMHLEQKDLKKIRFLVGVEDSKVIEEFENKFSALIGEGKAVSFATGRMGFYSLMLALSIKTGDEVVLQGATCSVMVNAVLRIGATPVYADIDRNTFGSSVEEISKVLTPHTRLIVAQHSFGLPCEIAPIVNLAREKKIFLLEDCALTVGSSINGIICGNFGDAALFSTDHSKPINTISGGLLYTRDFSLHDRLKKTQAHSGSFSIKKQRALWYQLILERKYCNPERYGQMKVIQFLYSKLLRLSKNSFANEDYGSIPSISYPYPSRMPVFLAAVGIIEISRWQKMSHERKETLNRLVKVIEKECDVLLPKVYSDPSREIIPLRLAWSSKYGSIIRQNLSHVLETEGTWFMDPVVASKEPIENFGYTRGSCSVSEDLGPNMINIPCNVSLEWLDVLCNSVNKHMNYIN
jgi:perosamine synthetase